MKAPRNHQKSREGRQLQEIDRNEVSDDPVDYYSNNLKVTINAYDVSIIFGKIYQDYQNKPFIKDEVVVRMSPQLFKVLSELISETLGNYEVNFGALPKSKSSEELRKAMESLKNAGSQVASNT